MTTPQLIQLQKQVQVMEQRCVLHEQQFVSIQTGLRAIDSRLDKLDSEIIILTAPVKIVKFLFKIAGWQFP